MLGIAPDIPIAGIGRRPAPACTLKPGMLIRGVVDDQLGDHPQLSPLGLLHEAAKVLHRAEIGIDVTVVRNVITVVAPRRWIEWQQPQGGDPEILEIVQLAGEAGEISDTVAVAVGKRLDVKLINDGVFEPELVALDLGFDLDLGRNIHGAALTRSSETAKRDRGPDRYAAGRRPIRAYAVRR